MEDSDAPKGVVVVRADTDGTFYTRPEPGKPLFAAQAETVAVRATLGLIEVMKTFNAVRAPIAGTVDRISCRMVKVSRRGRPCSGSAPQPAVDGGIVSANGGWMRPWIPVALSLLLVPTLKQRSARPPTPSTICSRIWPSPRARSAAVTMSPPARARTG